MEKVRKCFIVVLALMGLFFTVSCDKEKVWNAGSVAVTADFDFTLDKENAPSVLTIENKSVNGYTYMWTFTDGTPAMSIDKNPKVTYKKEGTYEIVLNVCNGNSCDKVTKSVTILAPLPVPVSADFTYAFASGSDYSPASVTFTDKSANPTTWAWTFTGGNPASSAQQNPGTVTYATSGKHLAKLQTSNSTGSAEKAETVKVYPGELVCSSATEQVWISPIVYPGVGTIGSLSFYLDKTRMDADQATDSKSGYTVYISAVAMQTLTQNASAKAVDFKVPASWDWDVDNDGNQVLSMTIYYMGQTGGLTVPIQELGATTMNAGATVYDATFSGLINSVEKKGLLLTLLSQARTFTKAKP